MYGRERITIMDIYKWRGLIPNGADMLLTFTKRKTTERNPFEGKCKFTLDMLRFR